MKNKIKIVGWTSIKQSKKLVEAGLSHRTSDMTYRRYKVKGKYEWFPECVPYNHWLTKDEDGCSMDLDNVKPCWSFGALLNLMPNFTMVSTEWCLYSTTSPDTDDDCYHEIRCDKNWKDEESSIMDNVVKMVIWMKKNAIL